MSEPGREIFVDEKQREAERAALRNVRGTLDRMNQEEIEQRRRLRTVLAIVGALAVLGLLYLYSLLAR